MHMPPDDIGPRHGGDIAGYTDYPAHDELAQA